MDADRLPVAEGMKLTLIPQLAFTAMKRPCTCLSRRSPVGSHRQAPRSKYEELLIDVG